MQKAESRKQKQRGFAQTRTSKTRGFTQVSTSKTRGFTLIELLVVIAIIGLLSSVILGSLNSARKKGRDARRLADVKELQVALELYYSNQTTPAYPANLAALAPTYIAAVPIDPNTGSNYTYAVAANNSYYCIAATMEASVPNPADSCNATSLGVTLPAGSFRVGP